MQAMNGTTYFAEAVNYKSNCIYEIDPWWIRWADKTVEYQTVKEHEWNNKHTWHSTKFKPTEGTTEEMNNNVFLEEK